MSPRSASATGGWASPDAAIDTRRRSSVMLTICPKCALTLVVTAEDLRVAQGYVRCGRCSSVFNALARLTEEEQTSAESVEPAPPAPAAASGAARQPAAREARQPAPREARQPAPREARQPAPREAPQPAPREARQPAPREAPQPAPREARQPAPRPATPAAGPAPEAPVRARSAASQARAPRKTRLGERVGPSAGMARLRPHLWSAGTGLALLLLLAQIVNHYRDELAATTRFHRSLTALYASLGVQLAPHWDLRAYEVRQLGASVEPASAGVITVRASVKNGAAQPQPLPVLRVTLQDRFGNRIAARDVEPRLYLPHARPAPALLSAGERIDAEMGFVDPGANAVGFEIDACLPTRGGEVTCANDAIAR